jgi:hypothetical protein
MTKSAIETDDDVRVPKKLQPNETPSDQQIVEDVLNIIAQEPTIPPYTAIRIAISKVVSKIDPHDFYNMRRRIKHRIDAIHRSQK